MRIQSRNLLIELASNVMFAKSRNDCDCRNRMMPLRVFFVRGDDYFHYDTRIMLSRVKEVVEDLLRVNKMFDDKNTQPIMFMYK